MSERSYLFPRQDTAGDIHENTPLLLFTNRLPRVHDHSCKPLPTSTPTVEIHFASMPPVTSLVLACPLGTTPGLTRFRNPTMAISRTHVCCWRAGVNCRLTKKAQGQPYEPKSWRPKGCLHGLRTRIKISDSFALPRHHQAGHRKP